MARPVEERPTLYHQQLAICLTQSIDQALVVFELALEEKADE